MKARSTKPAEIAWRVSVIRRRAEHLGTITAPPDKDAALAKAREVYGVADRDRANRLIVQPVKPG